MEQSREEENLKKQEAGALEEDKEIVKRGPDRSKKKRETWITQETF